jgi:hypothetical protein
MLLAAWLVALQAFLAGLAIAQAATMSLADPLAVICHGTQSGSPADMPVPDAGKIWHLCCTFCLSSAPAVIAPDTPSVAGANFVRIAPPLILSPFGVILARGVVRAGSSQAPPALA